MNVNYKNYRDQKIMFVDCLGLSYYDIENNCFFADKDNPNMGAKYEVFKLTTYNGIEETKECHYKTLIKLLRQYKKQGFKYIGHYYN
jgi:hypothetical protein